MKFKDATILLVEDNPGDVILAKAAFEEAKCKNTIEVAQDGEVALDYLFKRNGFENAETPDLILLDLNMPKKNGIEVLESIKDDDRLKLIPVVIMTSSQAEQDVVESYSLHASSYIVKPITLSKFTEIVKALDNFWFSVVVLPPKS